MDKAHSCLIASIIFMTLNICFFKIDFLFFYSGKKKCMLRISPLDSVQMIPIWLFKWSISDWNSQRWFVCYCYPREVILVWYLIFTLGLYNALPVKWCTLSKLIEYYLHAKLIDLIVLLQKLRLCIPLNLNVDDF